MAHLTLAGVGDDGKRLRLVDDDGVEHTLDIDERLRTALRGYGSRRLEIKMDSALRPRDIQARIRAGETPEAVAEAAQTSVDKIMAFAAPVLAERQHVADRAQRSSVRRTDSGGHTGGARTLGDAVAAHLRSQNVDPDVVEWDSWRREDGRWTLSARYATSERSGAAELTFDMPGNYVTLDNDDARWLVGEAIAGPGPQRDDLRQARQRRLSAVGDLDQELPLGADAIDLVSERPVEAFLDEEAPSDPEVAEHEARARRAAAEAAAEDAEAGPEHRRGHEHGAVPQEAAETPTEEPTPEPAEPAPEPAPDAASAQDDEQGQEQGQEQEQRPPRRTVKKTRGRASVPSWDEIMFGGSTKSE